ncbi:GDSL esterase/lipase At1g09390-like [Cucurbita moschata]|uniref:GDSL esterase/lipase At1g09390-like n=1 Tax=Cucurbita moschata TaxID=3662 RepID=A0A6J1G2L0_CUCMO|nr:GDSL esterase/lipase At1g09390-like [Cucurbita moschata]
MAAIVGLFTFLLLLLPPSLVFSQCTRRPPVIFNFGDSNSDTGGLVAGLGFPVLSPNGRTFFRRSTGRLSDGRLLIDFLCESLNMNLLNPYMDSLARSNFKNGANFAIVGSSTLPKYVPFSLNIQVMQFVHFKTRTLELLNSNAGYENLIDDDGFRNALYMIDIGQNDIADSLSKNLSYFQVVKQIPSVISEIQNAVKGLYGQGGRKFWIHNTGPLGCLPQKLSSFHTKDLDRYGCISSYNNLATLFNKALSHLCQELRYELKDASIVYVDIYTIKYDLIANSSVHGFFDPLMACCGAGGRPYNYDIRVTCGQPGYQVCNKNSKFISWDGIHYTEEANKIVASKVLSRAYSTPSLPFDFFCNN